MKMKRQNKLLRYNSVSDLATMSTAEAAATARNMMPVGIWSFNKYKSFAGSDQAEKENWDELEKSVVANLADDVTVGVSGNRIRLAITRRTAV